MQFVRVEITACWRGHGDIRSGVSFRGRINGEALVAGDAPACSWYHHPSEHHEEASRQCLIPLKHTKYLTLNSSPSAKHPIFLQKKNHTLGLTWSPNHSDTTLHLPCPVTSPHPFDTNMPLTRYLKRLTPLPTHHPTPPIPRDSPPPPPPPMPRRGNRRLLLRLHGPRLRGRLHHAQGLGARRLGVREPLPDGGRRVCGHQPCADERGAL